MVNQTSEIQNLSDFLTLSFLGYIDFSSIYWNKMHWTFGLSVCIISEYLSLVTSHSINLQVDFHTVVNLLFREFIWEIIAWILKFKLQLQGHFNV